MRKVIVTVVAAAIGFAAGFEVGRLDHPKSAPTSAVDQPMPTTVATKSAAVETSSSVETTPLLPPRANALDSLERLRTLEDLKRRGVLTHIHVPLFEGSSGRLSDAVVELLALSPGERQQLESAIAQARTELGRMEVARASASPQADGSVAISIRAFPQEGGGVYDRLEEALGRVLGPERKRSFASMTGDQLDASVGGAGTSDRTILIRERPATATEPATFEVTEHRGSSDSTGMTQRTLTRDGVESEYGELVRQHVGPEFWTRATSGSGN